MTIRYPCLTPSPLKGQGNRMIKFKYDWYISFLWIMLHFWIEKYRMKHTFLLVAISFFSALNCSAQEFSFPILFSDAIGHRDTIILGYDSIATSDLDSLFDGQNIISRPWDTTLDVRITDEYYYRNYENRPGTFHTKKQIFKFLCHNGLNDVITIDIHT